MTIRSKIIIILLGITLFPICLVGLLSFYVASNIIITTVLGELNSIASIQEARINYIVSMDKEELRLIVKHKRFLEALNSYYKEGKIEQKHNIEKSLSDLQNIQDFESLSIANPDGRVIFSTDDSLIEKNVSSSAEYINGKKEEFINFTPGAKNHLSMPLLYNGNFLGVIIAYCDDSEEITNVITDYSGLGNSGESFLVKDDGQGNAVFLMQRKYEKDPKAKYKIDKTEIRVPAIQALLKNETTMSDAIDYRGVPVLAATRYIESINCGLVIKMDESEALAPVNHLMFLISIIILLTFLGFITIAFPISKSILAPIARLRKGAELISSGSLDIKIGSRANDEIGQLAKSFDAMVESLKHKTTTIDNLNKEIKAREKAERGLEEIEWLLSKQPERRSYISSYGDLTKLNRSRLIMDSVGQETLTDIVSEYLDLLETSGAVYEKNGDYALGLFSSGWCQFLDSASRELCNTKDNCKALECGKWGCHESCWSEASKKSIETGEPIDIECFGGIHLFAIPIRTSNEIIGSINVGYGNPPSDPQKLEEIAKKCNVGIDKLREIAKSYNPRPFYIVELAKKRLVYSANLIGALVERKKAEEALHETNEYLQNLITYANAPIIVWDLQLRITQFNHAFELITGRKAGDVIGKSLELLFPLPLVESTMNLIRKTMSGERWEVVEINIQHIDGSVRTVLWNSAAILAADGKTILAIIAQGQDITERKKVENEIKAIAWDLQERSKELEIANKELESFSFSVSHDLRAPLRSIQGFSQILLEDCNDKLNSKDKEALGRISGAAERMEQLIEDILDLSRITRTKLTLTTVDLSKQVMEIANNLNQSNPERKVEFIIEPNVTVKGDERLLYILMENLLNNAWKFTSKKPMAKIEFGVKQEGEKVYFVKDNGAGFDMNYADKLFVAFQRLHSIEEFKGTGIGLTIVQRIVRRHKGEIWAEAEINKGAIFYFKL